jgi:hypothetical protein
VIEVNFNLLDIFEKIRDNYINTINFLVLVLVLLVIDTLLRKEKSIFYAFLKNLINTIKIFKDINKDNKD